MFWGRAFHNLGATTLKALAPIVTRRNLGVTSNPSLEEPMKVIEDRGNVIILSCVGNQASCRVLNIL